MSAMTWKQWSAIATLGIVAAASGANAASESEEAETSEGAKLPLTGRLYFNGYAPTKEALRTDYRDLLTSIWLSADPKLADGTRGHFTLQADARSSGVTWTLREGFAAWNRGNWELRLGRQIVPWGKSDAVNPTDFLSAKNFTVFNPDEEVRRVGTELVQWTWSPARGDSMSPWSVTAVFAPRPARSRFLIAPTTIPSGLTLAPESIVPAVGIDDGEYALKTAYQRAAWDLELLAFRGWNHFGDLQLDGTTLSLVHHRISALGLNASASSGSYVFRAESAWIWTENSDGANALLEPTHWDSVLGVERGFGDEFRLQLQVVSRFHPTLTSPEEAFPLPLDPRRTLATTNALIHGYQFKTRIGATLRAAYTAPSTGLEAELFLMGNFMGGDSLVRPKLSYPVTDSLRLTGGVDWYGGPKNRPLGALQDFNSVFFEGRASF